MNSDSDSNTHESPLSHDQMAQLGEARMNALQILHAARIAHREFVGLFLMGALTALFAFFGGISISALIMGIWMMAAGIIEYRGEQRIRRLDPKVFKTLRVNQLLLGAMFVVISAWWMLTVALGWDKDIVTAGNTLNSMGIAAQQMMPMVKLMLYAAYGSVGVFGVVWQGYLAWYYSRRQKQLADYIEDTPPWILELQQSGRLA